MRIRSLDARRLAGLAMVAASLVGLSGSAVLAAEPPTHDQFAHDQFGHEQLWKGEMGKLTVLDFAATWCGPCRVSLPLLQSFADQYPELRVVVISVDDSAAQRDRLVSDLELHLPVVWDAEHRIAEHYRPEAMPSTVVLDASGHEVYRHVGSLSDDFQRFTAFVEKALAEQGAAELRSWLLHAHGERLRSQDAHSRH